MTRGATPTYTFTLADTTINLGLADYVYVTFRQGSRSLRKTGGDITVSVNTCTVKLTQAETLAFASGGKEAEAQLNWVYADGSRACSEIVPIAVLRNLEPVVLPDTEVGS